MSRTQSTNNRWNKAERAYRACLRSQRVDIDSLRTFLRNRSLSWPKSTTADVHPLDVLLDLDINWNLGLWFTVRFSRTSLANQRLVRFDMGLISTSWKKLIVSLVANGSYGQYVRRFHNALKVDPLETLSERQVSFSLIKFFNCPL